MHRSNDQLIKRREEKTEGLGVILIVIGSITLTVSGDANGSAGSIGGCVFAAGVVFLVAGWLISSLIENDGFGGVVYGPVLQVHIGVGLLVIFQIFIAVFLLEAVSPSNNSSTMETFAFVAFQFGGLVAHGVVHYRSAQKGDSSWATYMFSFYITGFVFCVSLAWVLSISNQSRYLSTNDPWCWACVCILLQCLSLFQCQLSGMLSMYPSINIKNTKIATKKTFLAQLWVGAEFVAQLWVGLCLSCVLNIGKHCEVTISNSALVTDKSAGSDRQQQFDDGMQ
jgi:hypothetical protein